MRIDGLHPSVHQHIASHFTPAVSPLFRHAIMTIRPLRYCIPLQEIEFVAIRAQGAGGQNVNKVSSAIHLRFNVRASSLPDVLKMRLLALSDRRMTRAGVIIIKAQEYRTQEQNRTAALARLHALIDSASVTRKTRVPTRPTHASRLRRLDSKTRRSEIKAGRKANIVE